MPKWINGYLILLISIIFISGCTSQQSYGGKSQQQSIQETTETIEKEPAKSGIESTVTQRGLAVTLTGSEIQKIRRENIDDYYLRLAFKITNTKNEKIDTYGGGVGGSTRTFILDDLGDDAGDIHGYGFQPLRKGEYDWDFVQFKICSSSIFCYNNAAERDKGHISRNATKLYIEYHPDAWYIYGGSISDEITAPAFNFTLETSSIYGWSNLPETV